MSRQFVLPLASPATRWHPVLEFHLGTSETFVLDVVGLMFWVVLMRPRTDLHRSVLTALAVLVFFALFGLVGSLDYDEAIRQEAHYCEMVRTNVWPAYDPDVKCPSGDVAVLNSKGSEQ